jgi:hypothetical protein
VLIEHIIIPGAVSESRIVNSLELLKMLLAVSVQSSELITVCDAWLPSYRNCFSMG